MAKTALWPMWGIPNLEKSAESFLPKMKPGFPGGLDGKKSAHNMGDLGSIPTLGRSLGQRNDNPLQYSCLENSEFHGQRSLVGYSPLGHKESDTTEWLTRHNFQVKPVYLLSHCCRKTDSWQPHGRGPPSCQCVAGLHKDYDSILMGKIKSLVNNQTPPSLLSEQLCQRAVSN